MKSQNISLSIYLLLFIFLLSSLLGAQQNVQAKLDPLVSHIDSSVTPGNDFFLFANGKWFKENPIPPSESYNGIFLLVQDTINSQVKDICEASAKKTAELKGSNKQKIGDFFYSGMDSVSLNKNGMKDLENAFKIIDDIKSIKDIPKVVAYLYMVAGPQMFNFGVGYDDRNSVKNAVFIYQGGLSLPERSYYLDEDKRLAQIRGKFVEHMNVMFKLMGYPDIRAKKAADNVMNLEAAIAKASRKIEDLRDPIKNYNKITFKQLLKSTPNFNWNIFVDDIGLQNVDTVVICQPEFIKSLNNYLKKYSIEDWKDYLKYRLVRSLANYLDDKTYLESFNFYSAVLNGVKEPKPRWKRVVEETNNSLGELIGKVYINEYLPKGTKAKLLEIGMAIKDVFAERIKNLDWMSEKTKERALKKLNSMTMNVGYPDKWKDLSSLSVDRSSYVRNVINANKWKFNYNISKFGHPVDRNEWSMYPQTYNAYYSPGMNKIVIPGCNIIIPGYEHKLADDAILYSLLGGSFFGHEMTHGFDDQGRQYDVNGNLNNWWIKKDSIKFYEKSKMIVHQFDNYIAVDSLHINGEITQGENIADLGGIMMGYEAFKKTNQFKNNKDIAGYNPPQRFFLGYALGWMLQARPELIINQVRSDVHSPPKFRVIGPLSNMPEFYEAFNVKEGDAMWRPDSLRIKIW